MGHPDQSAGIGGGELTAACLHPAVAVLLAAVDAGTVLILVAAAVLLVARGSDRTWERIFRLLRWARTSPSPAWPAAPQRPQARHK
jgi:hypothetical protein